MHTILLLKLDNDDFRNLLSEQGGGLHQLLNVSSEEIRSLINTTAPAAIPEPVTVQPSPKTEDTPDGYMTVPETAAMLRVHKITVLRWMQKGILKAKHIGRRTLFKRTDVLRALDSKGSGVK